MDLLQGPVTAFAVLLAVGGAAKIRRPDTTVRALRSLRLPVGPFAVRLLAFAEVTIGVSTIAFGGRFLAFLLLASYGGFSGFVLLARAEVGTLSSCGCFGAPDTPPTITHLVVTVAASAAAAAAVADPVAPLLQGLGNQPLGGLPFLFLTGCCAWFAYLALALVPKSMTLVRPR